MNKQTPEPNGAVGISITIDRPNTNIAIVTSTTDHRHLVFFQWSYPYSTLGVWATTAELERLRDQCNEQLEARREAEMNELTNFTALV